jgi:hypothetical protein
MNQPRQFQSLIDSLDNIFRAWSRTRARFPSELLRIENEKLIHDLGLQ